MLVLQNKVLKNNSNQILKMWDFPPIVFENRYRYFPAYVVRGTTHNSGILIFNSSVTNTIYIDYGDGTTVYSQDFIGTINVNTLSRDYGTVATRFIKIWFKIPQKITSIIIKLCTFFGELPKAFSYFNLNTLNLSAISYYDDFNLDFPPSYLYKLVLNDTTLNTVEGIPEWILKSRIQILHLGIKINLLNSATNKLEQLIEVKDIQTFIWQDNIGSTDVPNNFKDISTLRYINIIVADGITTNIRDCKQITHLLYGYTGNFGDNGTTVIGDLYSWGVGIAGMNITDLSAQYCISVPTTLPTGIESCPSLKNLWFGNCYMTQARVDEFINNAYNTITNNASMTLGDTVLRQVYLSLVINSLGVRPTGVYQQPSGYIQGYNNGIPDSPMEKVWIMVKQYKWIITLMNSAGTGQEILK